MNTAIDEHIRQIAREEATATLRALLALPTPAAEPSIAAFLGTLDAGEYRASDIYSRYCAWAAPAPPPTSTWFGRHIRTDPRIVARRDAAGRKYQFRPILGAVVA